MQLLSLRQSKKVTKEECYRAMLTQLMGAINASKKKIGMELLTIRAATFWNSLPLGVVAQISNTITLKMDHTDVTEGTGCGCLHLLYNWQTRRDSIPELETEVQ